MGKIIESISCITFREAKKSDIPELVVLLDLLFRIEKDFAPDEFAQRTGLELLLKDNKASYVAVAEDGGKIVGMVTAQLRISTASGGYMARLEDLIVSTSHRGKGIGSILLRQATTWASSMKALGLELFADKDNIAALAFYNRNTWKRTNLIVLKKQITNVDC